MCNYCDYLVKTYNIMDFVEHYFPERAVNSNSNLLLQMEPVTVQQISTELHGATFQKAVP